LDLRFNDLLFTIYFIYSNYTFLEEEVKKDS